MSESYLVIKDRYLGISVTLRSGSRYEISMVEAAGAFATDALVGAVKRGVVGGGAKRTCSISSSSASSGKRRYNSFKNMAR